MFELNNNSVENNQIQSIEAVKNYFNKVFDSHFLVFITNRKQRDLLIFITALKIITQQGKFSKDVLNQYQLTDFFSIKSNILSIKDDILPINQNEIVLCLEKETEILKSLFSFYKTFSKECLNNEIDFAILTKMKKIENLTDELFLSRITSNQKFCDAILSQLKKCKTFNEIQENNIFIDKFGKEIDILYKKSC